MILVLDEHSTPFALTWSVTRQQNEHYTCIY